MDSAEFSEWIAMAQLEPALVYDELLFGHVCATVANSMSKKRGRKGFTPADFFNLDHEPKEQSEDQMMAVLERVTEEMNRVPGAGARMRRPKD